LAGQRGVGLIEVLIAVLVLSIGLLGIALAQTYSLSANNGAMSRTTAVAASYSIIDAMRINRARAMAGDYNTSGDPIQASDCPDADGSTLVSTQLSTWCNRDLAALGSTATGSINCQSSGVCTITITFHTIDCGGVGSDGLCSQTLMDEGVEQAAQQIVTTARL